jgi:hypothetical protein
MNVGARMENDLALHHTPEQTPDPSARLAIASEYAAFQLGQINRKVDTMIEAPTASIVKR